MASITAIVPTYNRAVYVGDCLRSLLSQSRALDQILVVDDGSTDGTPAVLAPFADRLEILRKVNGGKSSALNLALEHAHGDYIWICDDDDLACPGAAAALEQALDEHGDAPFAYGRFERFREENGTVTVQPHSYYGREGGAAFLVQVLEEMFVFQFAMLVRREAYRRTGPFDPAMIRSQDFDMLARLTVLGDPVFVPEVIFRQRQHEGVRGSAAARVEAGQTHQTAIDYGGRVVRRFRDTLPVAAFRPRFANGRPALETRAALLARGLACAQRSLWSEAAEDFYAAAALAGNDRPAAPERALPALVVRSRMPWRVLAEDGAAQDRLAVLRHRNRYGRGIVAALADQTIIWMLRAARARDGNTVRQHSRTLARVLGRRGLAMAVTRHFATRLFGRT